MPTDALTGLPYDSPLDAPNGAAQMDRLIMAMNGAGATPVIRVADQAGRDALDTPPAGVLCTTTAAPWLVWLSTGTGWITVLGDSTVVTTGFSFPNADWTADGGWTRITPHGPMATLSFSVTSPNGISDPATDGNISDKTLFVVPPMFKPASPEEQIFMRCTEQNGGGKLTGAGNVQLTTLTPGLALRAGNYVRGTLTYRYLAA